MKDECTGQKRPDKKGGIKAKEKIIQRICNEAMKWKEDMEIKNNPPNNITNKIIKQLKPNEDDEENSEG
jgi:hypothetical protein